jgi:2-polyprenyl-3-methyl-5-hydroxy-6-metoxy-1,4-benzoquinol methylase
MSANPEMQEKIGERIRQAHDRVADSYGLSPVDHAINPESYDGWNFQTNVVRPLSQIVSKYWMNAHVLDAGCGNGQISEVLLDAGAGRITGVDFSENMLRNAVRRSRRGSYECKFLPCRADIENLAMLKPGVFDGAILFGVLEHLDHPGRVISSIYETLKTGSIFAIAVPRRGSLSYLSYVLFGQSPNRWGRSNTWRDRFRFAEKTTFYRFFSLSEMTGIVSDISGAENIERIPFAYCHLDGFPGSLLRLAGKNKKIGHAVLRFGEKTCASLGLIPAGEFWLIRKNS